MFFRNVFLTWMFFACFAYTGYAGTVGDSHNNTTAIGRSRANVIYHPVMTSVQQAKTQTDTPQYDQPIIEPSGIVSEAVTESEPVITPDLTADIAAASEYITHLQNEIKKIDSEIARCKKAKTNWTIGTVVGGIGVAGTATGAIVQAVQINKAKKNGATESTSDTDTSQESE